MRRIAHRGGVAGPLPGVAAAAVLAACGAGRVATSSEAARPSPATAAASSGTVAASDAGALLSAADRARLATLCADRGAGAGRADGSGDAGVAASDGREAVADGYRIGPDDLVEVRIPDLLEAQAPAALGSGGAIPGRAALAAAPVFQQGLRVDAAGNLTIATLGSVHAAGLTASELERDIAGRLVRAGILDAPQVSVLIVEYRSHVAAVVGSVERPGVYPVTHSATTLADLVWGAGGPTRDAGRMVQFTPAGTRTSPGSPAVRGSAADTGPPIRLDLELLLHSRGEGACSVNPPARPGDVVSLAPAGSVQVAGWVDKPGTVPVTRGLTVTGAIAAAGGELFAADGSSVVVRRVLGPGEEKRWAVDLAAIADGRQSDVPLTDGDVVTVPAANAKLVPYGLWTLTKDVIHVGGSFPLF
jgi:polysaccharide export outer membrane protein